MDKLKRKHLLEEYKKIKTYMGITQITNLHNGKIYLAAYPNLKNKWLSLQNQLNMGKHINYALQQDWTALGPEAFEYQVLEQQEAEPGADNAWELKKLLKKWLALKEPYDNIGYNKRKQVKQ